MQCYATRGTACSGALALNSEFEKAAPEPATGPVNTLLTNRAAALSLSSESTLESTDCATGSLNTLRSIAVSLSPSRPSLLLSICRALYASTRAGEGFAACAAGAAALSSASERAFKLKVSPGFCPCLNTGPNGIAPSCPLAVIDAKDSAKSVASAPRVSKISTSWTDNMSLTL